MAINVDRAKRAARVRAFAARALAGTARTRPLSRGFYCCTMGHLAPQARRRSALRHADTLGCYWGYYTVEGARFCPYTAHVFPQATKFIASLHALGGPPAIAAWLMPQVPTLDPHMDSMQAHRQYYHLLSAPEQKYRGLAYALTVYPLSSALSKVHQEFWYARGRSIA